jgi:hypothetical protein
MPTSPHVPNDGSKVDLGDVPISNRHHDLLHFWAPATRLAFELTQVADGSGIVAAVLGEWGSGKTGFMTLVEEALKEQSTKENMIVWFSAWQYQDSGQMGDVLVYKLFRRASEEIPQLKSRLKKLEIAFGMKKSAAQQVGQALAIARDLSSAVAPQVVQSGIKAAKAFVDQIKPSSDIEACIDELARQLMISKKRVFIFLDDLDRTYPQQIAAALSTLRIYLDRARIGVVLGYDEGYVLQALRGQLPPEVTPERYIQKIVTLRVQLPPRNQDVMMSYCRRIFERVLPGLQKEFYQFSSEEIVSLIGDNPRKIKRTVLSLGYLLVNAGNVQNKKFSSIGLETLFGLFRCGLPLLLVSEMAPKAYSLVAAKIMKIDSPGKLQELIGALTESVEFKKTLESIEEKDAASSMINWLAGEIDNYFYLQQIISVLGGVSEHEPEEKRRRAEGFFQEPLNREILHKAFLRPLALPGDLLNASSPVKSERIDLAFSIANKQLLPRLMAGLPSQELAFDVPSMMAETSDAWGVGIGKQEVWVLYSKRAPWFEINLHQIIVTLAPLLARQTKRVRFWVIETEAEGPATALDAKDTASLQKYFSENFADVRIYFTTQTRLPGLKRALVNLISTE